MKVTDFGIARIDSTSMTAHGSVVGTPSYMSPEQFTGQEIDRRSDIFSTGVVLFELLTGQKPFPGKSATEVMYKLLNHQPPAVTTLNPTLPIAMNAVVLKALSRNPDERFATAAEFKSMMRQAAATAPASEDMTVVMMAPPPQPAAPAASATETTGIRDEATLRVVSDALAYHIGPVAKVVVEQAAKQAIDVGSLYDTVATSISGESERNEFLRGKAPQAAAPPAGRRNVGRPNVGRRRAARRDLGRGHDQRAATPGPPFGPDRQDPDPARRQGRRQPRRADPRRRRAHPERQGAHRVLPQAGRGLMPVQVVMGAMAQCSFGTAPATLVVADPTRPLVSNMPAANIMDFAPMANLPTFGMCNTPSNPMVASATAAALGVLTPMPCVPATAAPWVPGAPTTLIGSMPALHNGCQCMCMWGGVIAITNPGQTQSMV